MLAARPPSWPSQHCESTTASLARSESATTRAPSVPRCPLLGTLRILLHSTPRPAAPVPSALRSRMRAAAAAALPLPLPTAAPTPQPTPPPAQPAPERLLFSPARAYRSSAPVGRPPCCAHIYRLCRTPTSNRPPTPVIAASLRSLPCNLLQSAHPYHGLNASSRNARSRIHRSAMRLL